MRIIVSFVLTFQKSDIVSSFDGIHSTTRARRESGVAQVPMIMEHFEHSAWGGGARAMNVRDMWSSERVMVDVLNECG